MTATITGNGIDKVQDGSIQAADLASGVPSRSQLPAGTVLQVVYAKYSTAMTLTTNSYADVVSASITPTSATSKILVISDITIGKNNNIAYANLRLLKDSTNLINYHYAAAYNGATTPNYVGTVSSSYLDSPASTSSLTYKIQVNSADNNANVLVNYDNSTSTLVLMEIAA